MQNLILPFCLLLSIQNPREIKRIAINVENDAISGTNKFFFPQDSILIQSSGLSSTLKKVKDANILFIISLEIFALYKKFRTEAKHLKNNSQV